MYCTHCGKEVFTEASYCPQCGGAQPGVMNKRRLVRPRQGRKIAGVCRGVANYLDLDVTLVRVVWLLLAVLAGGGVIAYLVCWLLMAEEEYLPTAVPAQPPRNP